MDKDLKLISEAYSFLKNKINSLNDFKVINEESNITYYELRKLFKILTLQTKDPVVTKVLQDILKTLTKLEIRNVPIPVLKKSLKDSRRIFKEIKKK